MQLVVAGLELSRPVYSLATKPRCHTPWGTGEYCSFVSGMHEGGAESDNGGGRTFKESNGNEGARG
jgi:hypothetical protein